MQSLLFIILLMKLLPWLLHAKCNYYRSMPKDICNQTCISPYMCKIPSISEKSLLPMSLSTMQSHMPNGDHIVVIATLVTATFCFLNSALSCFILNEAFKMLQQQETLYFRYADLGLYVPFQLVKRNYL